MAELFKLAAGWTRELGPFTLRNAGVRFNLGGYTVSLLLRALSSGEVATYTTASGVRVAEQAGETVGDVYFAPPSATVFVGEETYSVRWKVVDGAGKVAYFPHGETDTIVGELP